jgi:hypothetical protein
MGLPGGKVAAAPSSGSCCCEICPRSGTIFCWFEFLRCTGEKWSRVKSIVLTDFVSGPAAAAAATAPAPVHQKGAAVARVLAQVNGNYNRFGIEAEEIMNAIVPRAS